MKGDVIVFCLAREEFIWLGFDCPTLKSSVIRAGPVYPSKIEAWLGRGRFEGCHVLFKGQVFCKTLGVSLSYVQACIRSLGYLLSTMQESLQLQQHESDPKRYKGSYETTHTLLSDSQTWARFLQYSSICSSYR